MILEEEKQLRSKVVSDTGFLCNSLASLGLVNMIFNLKEKHTKNPTRKTIKGDQVPIGERLRLTLCVPLK